MAKIKSSQTQTIIERLLQNLSQTQYKKVWIGGRRSTDNTWRYMNGTVFNKNGKHFIDTFIKYL